MLNRHSPIPLYHQLRETLRQSIENGRYKHGDALPTEAELESQFNISRITVRRAIIDLVNEGLLSRERGRGTYVSKPKITQKLNYITSWAETVIGMGMSVKTIDCIIEYVVAPSWVARLLVIPTGQEVTRISRVRCADAEPMCIMTNHLLSDYVPGLVEDGLQSESLYETLENRYHFVLGKAEELVEAVLADEHQAKVLKICKGAPLLSVTRVTYDVHDVPFEVVKAVSRADKYQYSSTMMGRPKLKKS